MGCWYLNNVSLHIRTWMRELSMKYVFGPVFSRRLGLSLGVNNIPYKVCTYSCIYCQLGRTLRLSIERRPYSEPERAADEVADALEEVGRVDYVTIVPDGEPTLDTRIGDLIKAIKRASGERVAVLTNGSLLWLEDVREALASADLVSVKVDAGDEATWRRVDRPHKALSFKQVFEGMEAFARDYGGVLITETMLVEGVNDSVENAEAVAGMISRLSPAVAYVMVPTRPPAEEWIRAPPKERVREFVSTLEDTGLRVVPLVKGEEKPPRCGADIVSCVLDTIKVHPLPLDHVEALARERGASLDEVLAKALSADGVELAEFGGRRFLVWRPRRVKD